MASAQKVFKCYDTNGRKQRFEHIITFPHLERDDLFGFRGRGGGRFGSRWALIFHVIGFVLFLPKLLPLYGVRF